MVPVLTCADLSQFGADREEMPWWRWWLSLLQLLFQQRKKTFGICSTTIVRRLPSGMVVTLAAFPQSTNSTTIECNIFARYLPKEARLEALKMQTAAELDIFVVEAKKGRAQGDPTSFAASLPRKAGFNALLEMHLDSEKSAGAEIHPAARSQNFSMEGKADDDCKKISP